MNLEKFSLMYADSGIVFPKSYGAFSCDDALVMSFEEGWRFDDRESILSRVRYQIPYR